MSYAIAPLGTTTNTVRVDLDTQFASFGPDASNLWCWICADDEAMNQGAWLITGTHRDGRLNWDDADRYVIEVPSYMTDTRVKTIVCTVCAKGHAGAKKMKITLA